MSPQFLKNIQTAWFITVAQDSLKPCLLLDLLHEEQPSIKLTGTSVCSVHINPVLRSRGIIPERIIIFVCLTLCICLHLFVYFFVQLITVV